MLLYSICMHVSFIYIYIYMYKHDDLMQEQEEGVYMSVYMHLNIARSEEFVFFMIKRAQRGEEEGGGSYRTEQN